MMLLSHKEKARYHSQKKKFFPGDLNKKRLVIKTLFI